MQDVYQQRPRIYTPGNSKKIIQGSFLNKPWELARNASGELTYNDVYREWQLDLGTIHGITSKSGTIEILDPSTHKKLSKGSLKKLFVSSTLVTPEYELDPSKVYPVIIDGFLSRPISIYIPGANAMPNDQKQLFESIVDKLNCVSIKDEEVDADYSLRFLNGNYYISKPGDLFRPLVNPVQPDDKGDFVNYLLSCLNHISRWGFICNLKNLDKTSLLPPNVLDIKIKVLDKKGESNSFLNPGKVGIDFIREKNEWANSVGISITNKSKTDLYCCAVYLSTDFKAFTGFLNPPVYLLEPDNSVDLKLGDSTEIPVSLDKVMTTYNWDKMVDQIKFIVSTKEFDSSLFSLDSLPLPYIPNQNQGNARGLATSITEKNDKEIDRWGTIDIALELVNPLFNKVAKKDLELLLKDENIADFALGIYFNPIFDGESHAYQLKPEINIETTDKGFIGDTILDVANRWARRSRNNYYSTISKRFPERVKIVAEGDSWFQHPLVLDIIDHLSKLYSIYCVSAAGDKLRNYLSQEKKNGEYFIDAIRTQKPAIFLLSGGGNDILGSQFRDFLVDQPDMSLPPGQNPRRFLHEAIFEEITTLMQIYERMLTHVEDNFESLYVIMHGYDYPIKLDDPKKGWLGKYMIEKGISRAEDRVQTIRLIMDTFNQKLQEVASKFRRARYLDVRNVVRYKPAQNVDQWYDEIHPNNDGFQQISLRFGECIDTIIKEQKEA